MLVVVLYIGKSINIDLLSSKANFYTYPTYAPSMAPYSLMNDKSQKPPL